MSHLNGQKVFSKVMRVTLSKHQTVALPREGLDDQLLTKGLLPGPPLEGPVPPPQGPLEPLKGPLQGPVSLPIQEPLKAMFQPLQGPLEGPVSQPLQRPLEALFYSLYRGQ